MAIILATPVRTIEKHVERILHKLGVANRVAAAVAIAEIIHG
jgi:DNA-binding NarL/FixJ family response regulator